MYKLNCCVAVALVGLASRSIPTNAQCEPVAQLAGSALLFDGAIDLATIADSASLRVTTSATIELWIRPTTPFSTFQRFVNKGDGAVCDSNRAFELMITPSSGREGVQSDFFTGDCTGWTPLVACHTFLPGEWAHVAAVYDAAEGKTSLFINGSLLVEGTVSATGDPISQAIFASTFPLILGSWNGSGLFYGGEMDELRIWGLVRAPEQVVGRPLWDIVIPKWKLKFKSTKGVEDAIERTFDVLLDPENGNILRVASRWPQGVAGEPQDIPAQTAEEEMGWMSDKYLSFPDEEPRITFAQALEVVYRQGVGNPLVAKRIKGRYVVQLKVPRGPSPVWAITLEGIHVPAPGSFPGIGRRVSKRMRNIVDARTGEWIGASNIPRPISEDKAPLPPRQPPGNDPPPGDSP